MTHDRMTDRGHTSNEIHRAVVEQNEGEISSVVNVEESGRNRLRGGLSDSRNIEHHLFVTVSSLVGVPATEQPRAARLCGNHGRRRAMRRNANHGVLLVCGVETA